MTFKKLALQLTEREGLKKEVSVAQVRELLGHLCDVIFEERVEDGISETMRCLLDVGEKRARKNNR